MAESVIQNPNSNAIRWFNLSRTNITQAMVDNYWTIGNMPALTGYTRKVIGMRSSDNDVLCVRYDLDASTGVVRVYTYNKSGASKTFNLYAIAMYLPDSMVVSN